MPLPQRKPDESHDEFIERCMGDAAMVEEFPDAAQRRAICERQSRVRAEACLSLVCAPGSITIEAAEENLSDGENNNLPRFSMVAYTGGLMRVAGWRYPVIVDLAGLSIPSQRRPVRFGHDATSGVGHTDSITVEGEQLIATGVVSRDTPIAREIVVSARNGFPWQASIGASVEEQEFVRKDQKALVNGREVVGPVNVIRRATLGEISFVDIGADSATTVRVAAAAGEICPKEGENMDEHDVVVESTALEAAGPQKSDPAAEADRILAIRQVCAGRHPEIEAQAIEEDWDVRRVALAVLRAERPTAMASPPANGGVLRAKVVEAALALQAGLPISYLESEYPDEILTQAEPLRRCGFRFLADRYAVAVGHPNFHG